MEEEAEAVSSYVPEVGSEIDPTHPDARGFLINRVVQVGQDGETPIYGAVEIEPMAGQGGEPCIISVLDLLLALREQVDGFDAALELLQMQRGCSCTNECAQSLFDLKKQVAGLMEMNNLLRGISTGSCGNAECRCAGDSTKK